LKISKIASNALLAAGALLAAATAFASDWKSYEARDFGFSMLVPAGAAVKEREWGGGWGGLFAEHEGVRLYGRAKLGAGETDEAIEKYALKTIGIAAGKWTRIDQGKNQRGWKRYYTFKANVGSKLVFGGYGVGPKGNYLLYLETTPDDFMEHRADYDRWYESIRLQ
jgi:hypothetical protein